MDFQTVCARIGFIILFIVGALVGAFLFIIPFNFIEAVFGTKMVIGLLFIIIGIIVNQLYPWKE